MDRWDEMDGMYWMGWMASCIGWDGMDGLGQLEIDESYGGIILYLLKYIQPLIITPTPFPFYYLVIRIIKLKL